MVDAKSLSDDELLTHLEQYAREERERLHEFLLCLAEVDDRRILEPRGYHSTFDYCVRALKLSEGEAFRRIHATRAISIRPELLAAVESGSLSLTAISRIAPHVRRPDAPEIIARAEGKTIRQIEEILAPLSPVPPRRDLIREVVVATPYQEEARVEFKFQGSRELRIALDRVRQLLSHKYPYGALDSVLMELATEYLERHDPLAVPVKRKSPVRGSSTIRAAVRRPVWIRDGGRCSYFGPGGIRCESRKFLELDHIIPRALGGPDTVENLRLLCRAHNDSERRRILGEGTTSSLLSVTTRESLGSLLDRPAQSPENPHCASP